MNKVLRGGPWRNQQVPIVIQPYDVVKSIKSFIMDSLFFWVRIQNIPPKYEIPENFPSIASVVGRYIEYDDKLFIRSKKVRVRVEMKLSDPILNSKTIKLASDVDEEINFYFENCLGICDACNLVFHEHGKCQANSSYNTAGHCNANIIPNPAFVISFASKALVHRAFKFQGSVSPSTPIATSVFDQKKEKMHKCPTILKKPTREPEDDALSLIPVNDPDQTFDQNASEHEPKDALIVREGCKRGKPSSPETSPKKLKVLIDLLQLHETHVHTKRMKHPNFLATLPAKALGLTPDPTEMTLVATKPQKKKRGRPIDSKNSKLRRSVNQEDMTCSLTPPAMPPSPSVKDKEVL
ncbi:hypothetical protein ACLB2K_055375 [Fragaria x ananassa]